MFVSLFARSYFDRRWIRCGSFLGKTPIQTIPPLGELKRQSAQTWYKRIKLSLDEACRDCEFRQHVGLACQEYCCSAVAVLAGGSRPSHTGDRKSSRLHSAVYSIVCA